MSRRAYRSANKNSRMLAAAEWHVFLLAGNVDICGDRLSPSAFSVHSDGVCVDMDQHT